MKGNFEKCMCRSGKLPTQFEEIRAHLEEFRAHYQTMRANLEAFPVLFEDSPRNWSTLAYHQTLKLPSLVDLGVSLFKSHKTFDKALPKAVAALHIQLDPAYGHTGLQEPRAAYPSLEDRRPPLLLPMPLPPDGFAG